MIKYNLKCNNNHEFESWFSDSTEFDKLKKKKLLECIFCHSKKINKSIMSPMLSGTRESNKVKMMSESLQKEKNKLEDNLRKKEMMHPMITNYMQMIIGNSPDGLQIMTIGKGILYSNPCSQKI